MTSLLGATTVHSTYKPIMANMLIQSHFTQGRTGEPLFLINCEELLKMARNRAETFKLYY